MRTPAEALMDAMIAAGWADETSGDVEAPTGHFARFNLTMDDMTRTRAEFADVLDSYGLPDPSDIVGPRLVCTDSNGFITITAFDTEANLSRAYQELDLEYSEWG